jgi:hypothetical protein
MILLFLLTFVLSGSYILYSKKKQKETIQSQFVVTGCLLTIFYIVCFLSGICTIINFIWKYVL